MTGGMTFVRLLRLAASVFVIEMQWKIKLAAFKDYENPDLNRE